MAAVDEDETLSFMDSSSTSDDLKGGMSAGALGGAAAVGSREHGERSSSMVGYFKSANHPCAALFHVLFKVLALATYIFCTVFTDNFVLVFVLCVLLFAFDFWTVKNVTGRLLVGLRWWNDVAEDGSNLWRYESCDNPAALGTADHRIFWVSMYVSVATWALLGFLALLKLNFEWLLVVVIALVLSSANLVGYYRCDKDAKANMSARVNSLAAQGAMSVLSGRFSTFFGGGGGAKAAEPLPVV